MLRRALLLLSCLVLVAPASAAGGDPMLPDQYALAQLRVADAWKVTQGRGIVVAVVDTGVDLGHPEFRGRLVPGATFVECGPTPCGNGDWRSGPSNRRGEAYGHGTSVAGTIVAARNNGAGIAGVAPLAKVMPLKTGDRLGLTVDDLAYAVRWATRHGADVINLSVGFDPTTTPALSDAVADAIEHGIVVVASAGNRSQPWCVAPAFDNGVICVTATDRNEQPAVYSSGAVKPDLNSVAAPGGAGLPSQVAAVPYPDCTERILSTWPRNDPGVGRCPGQGGYRWLSGTSLAAPHVCGVMALLLSQGRSRDNAIEALFATARTPQVGTGAFTPSYGHGIVDAAAAVRYPRY